MAVAIHGDGQRGMACEGLDGLRSKAQVDPARHRKMPQRMPIEALGRDGMSVGVLLMELGEPEEEGIEVAFDHVGVVLIPAALVRKYYVVGTVALGALLPCPQFQD